MCDACNEVQYQKGAIMTEAKDEHSVRGKKEVGLEE